MNFAFQQDPDCSVEREQIEQSWGWRNTKQGDWLEDGWLVDDNTDLRKWQWQWKTVDIFGKYMEG